MADDVWRRDEPDSPCIQVCVVHPESRLCTGCYRSIDEIAGWAAMSSAERRAVMAELPARAGKVTRRRGGRKGRQGT